MSEVKREFQKQVYTEKEMCQVLQISHETLRQLRIKGKIAYSMVGAQIRYTQKDLDDYLESTKISPNKRLIKKAS